VILYLVSVGSASAGWDRTPAIELHSSAAPTIVLMVSAPSSSNKGTRTISSRGGQMQGDMLTGDETMNAVQEAR
jgi:hypothetical protein